MKKTLSLFLSLVMLLSCFSVLHANAAGSGDVADMLYSEESIAAADAALRYLEIKNFNTKTFCKMVEQIIDKKEKKMEKDNKGKQLSMFFSAEQ